MDTFSSLQARMFDLYAAMRYDEALAVVEGGAARFPEEAARTGFWRVCLIACLERPDEALGLFESWADAGHWLAPSLVLEDPDLTAFREDPRFGRVLALLETRHEEAQARARPDHGADGPTGTESEGLLVALHGRTGHAPETLASWQKAVEGGWRVLAPQSSQMLGPRSFCWDDPELGKSEVVEGIEAERNRHPDLPPRLVLAGFSQGAALAVRLAFDPGLDPRGLIAVVPSIAPDLWPDGVPDGRTQRFYAQLVSGGRDPRAATHRALAKRLAQADVRVDLDAHPSVGHAYPPAFDETLEGALARMPR